MRLLLSFILTVFFLVFPPITHAQIFSDWSACGASDGNQIVTLECFPTFLMNLINGLLIFAGVAATALIMLGGIRYISSSGDQVKVEKARRTLTYAVIGLILIVLSFVFLNFLSTITGSPALKSIDFR